MTADVSEINVGSGVELEGKVGLGLETECDGKEAGDPIGIACRVGDEKDGVLGERSVAVENGNLDDSSGKDLDLDAKVDPVTIGDHETSEGKEENGELSLGNGSARQESVDPMTKLAVTVHDSCVEKTDSTDVQEEVVIESDSKEAVSAEGHADSDEQKEGCKVEDCTISEMESDAKSGICEEEGVMCEEVNVELSLETGHDHLEDPIITEASEDKIEVEADSDIEVGGSKDDEAAVKERNLEELESPPEVETKLKTAVAEIADQIHIESMVYDDEKQEPNRLGIVTDQQEEPKSSVVEGREQDVKTVLNGTYLQVEQKVVDIADEKPEIATTDAEQTDEDPPVVVEAEEPQSLPTAPNKHDQAESIVLESRVLDIKEQVELELTTKVDLEEEPRPTVTEVVDQAAVVSIVEFAEKPESLVKVIEPSESCVEQHEMSLSTGSTVLSTEECLDENRNVPIVDNRISLETVVDSKSSENQNVTPVSDIDASVNKAEAGVDTTETSEIVAIEHSDDLYPTEGSSSSGVPHVDDKKLLVEAASSRQVLVGVSDQSAGCEEASPLEPEGGSSSASNVPSPSDLPVKSCSNVAENGSALAGSGIDVADAHVDVVKSESMVETESGGSNTSLVSSTEDEPSLDDNQKTADGGDGVVEVIQAPTEVPNISTLDGEKVDTPLGKPQPCHIYIIKIPRFFDDQLLSKIQIAQSEVNEKTQRRDSIKVSIEKQKATCNEFWKKFEGARTEERAARDAVTSKRQQIDSVQSTINKLKNVHSIEELDNKIQSMEFDLQHETMPLKEEKKYIHELKQLRHRRDELTCNMGSKEEIDDAFDQKELIDERFKILKKELDSLRTELLRTEAHANAARKKYDEEQQLLRGLQQQFKDADAVRQKAYAHWRELKSMLIEKNKPFNMYKNDQKSAENYLSSRDFEGLRLHCSQQVEKVMSLWNNDEEFRTQYVKSNMNSTLRRLRTADGRSLGLDEEPPVLHSYQGKNSGITLQPAKISEAVPLIALEAKVETPKEVDSFPALQSVNKSQPIKPKKSAKPISDEAKEAIVARVSDREIEIHDKENIPTKEEEELRRKAEELSKKEEELRKEKAAAELKEQCRLEQRAKAKEAEERKRRQAEKAQVKAEYRAQKEAELREKKRAKKQKKKGVAAEDASVSGSEEVPAPSTESCQSETAQEPDVAATTAPRRPSRPAVAPKQYKKMQPIPLPLLKRGKRKMTTWMWVLLTVVAVLLLFLAGNYISFSSFSFPHTGL